MSPQGQRPGAPNTLGNLGRFELRQLLGQGAFGRVYKAYDPQLDRFVALKVPVFSADDERLVQRFITEAKAAARLRHPNIVPVFDVGKDGGQLFIATAFIEGQTLAARLTKGRPSFRESAQCVMALASALESAHTQGIVHRDVKPANIMLDSGGTPLLMDFGLAQIRENEHKLTFDGSVLGTPAYMSPEQAAGKIDEVGPASDQYSLGVVLYELLAGKRPFDGPTALVLAKVIQQEPPSPSQHDKTIPSGLELICLTAIAKRPDQRFTNCQQLADELGCWLESTSIAANSTSSTRHVAQRSLSRLSIQRFSKATGLFRRRPIASVAVLTLIAVSFGLLSSLIYFKHFRTNPNSAIVPVNGPPTAESQSAAGRETSKEAKSKKGEATSPKTTLDTARLAAAAGKFVRPPADVIALAKQQLRDSFKAELASSKKKERTKSVNAIVERANAAKEPDAQFALFELASEAAMEVGDFTSALETCAHVTKSFFIDPVGYRAEIVTRGALLSPPGKPAQTSLARAALAVGFEMLAADNFTSARALQAIAAAASKAAGDDSVISSSEQLKEDLERQSKATTGITNSRVRRIGALETELLGKFRTVELLKLTG